MRTLYLLKIAAGMAAVAVAGVALAGEPIHALSRSDIVADGGVVPTEGLLVSGQPDADVFDRLKALGYVAVIDMRTDGEDRGMDEEGAAAERGLTYINLPVAGAEGVSFHNAERLDAILSDIDGPVLLHCGTGNRAAALLALRASLNGASDDEALAVGHQAGLTRMEAVVKDRLQSQTARDRESE